MKEEKEKHYKEVELRSEEVQEVMNDIPPWILRNGITILFCIMLTLIVGCYFFKYPDIIKAEITITTLDPPVSILAHSTGKLDQLFAKEDDSVKQGTPLAVIQNSASTTDMLFIAEMMQRIEKQEYDLDSVSVLINNRFLNLGDIQSVYNSFLNSLNDYINYNKLNYYPKKIISQKEQLGLQKEYYREMKLQQSLATESYISSCSVFRRDSILHAKDLISTNEYDLSNQSYIQSKRAYMNFQSSLKQQELQVVQLKESLLDLEKQNVEIESQYQLALQSAIKELSAQTKNWEQNYLLASPISGVIKQMGIWSENQNVNVGEIVFSIIPKKTTTPRGKALLPIQGAGKVRVGQLVNVRVDNYPDQEFGYLKGKVKSISNTSTEKGFYILEIEFIDGMKTNYNKTLPINQEQKGTAEIITEDLRLMERLFMPLKKIFMGQRK